MVNQETIIFRSMVTNHVFDAVLKEIQIFGGKMGVAATVAPRGLGSQDPTKICQMGGPFGSSVISKTNFQA